MKTYTLEKTNNPDLFRVVDRNGDWRYYFHKPSGKYLHAVNAILDAGYAKGARFEKYLLSVSKEEAEKKLQFAGDRGDAIHQAIAKLLQEKKASRNITVLAEDNKTERALTNDEWDCLLAFAEFWNRHDAKLIESEKAVCNLDYGYAGTLDAIITLNQNCGVKTCKCDEFIGKTILVDWKSSAGIYPSYGSQVAAYAKTYPNIEVTGIVRVGSNHKTTGGYEFLPFNERQTEDNWRKFLAAQMIAELEPFDEQAIYDVPDSIILEAKVRIPIIGTINSKTEKVTITKKVAKRKIIKKK